MMSQEIYRDLQFPPAPVDRPYVFINMVATIDGKIVSGERDEAVVDLGSKLDHALMKRIEGVADAVMLGAGTLRAAYPSWNPNSPMRVVVTKSGELDFESKFFAGRAIVATSAGSHLEAPAPTEVMVCGEREVDLRELLNRLKLLGVERLLVLGGSTLNAQLLGQNLVDELFMTIAPKIKLGRDVPTYADGDALARDQIQEYEIVETHRVENELFLRYRRRLL